MPLCARAVNSWASPCRELRPAEGASLMRVYVVSSPLTHVDKDGLAKHKWDSPYCIALRNTIDDLKKETEDRYKELDDDLLGMPERLGPGEKLRETIRGHRTLINIYDNILKRRQKEFDDDCDPPPPGCDVDPPVSKPERAPVSRAFRFEFRGVPIVMPSLGF